MSVVEVLERLGGVASRRRLVALTSRASVDRALAVGDLVVLARGRYGLPTAELDLQAAHQVGGVVSHLSAALHWGWAVKSVPTHPHVTVPRGRKLARERRRGVTVHHGPLLPEEVLDGWTNPERTLHDCLRSLPADEALAVADSALRSGFPHARLVAVAAAVRGPGAVQARWVARHATPKAANPFESALRKLCHEVPGLRVRPQVPLFATDFLGQPDLVDEDLRIVIEADSFTWHGGRQALHRDALRYNAFVAHGWLVLRFSWEEVMLHPDRVLEVLRAVVELRTDLRCPRCRAA